MPQRTLSAFSILVPDYDEAIEFYVGVLGFSLVEDTQLSKEKRWVIISPGKGSNLLLAKAKNETQKAAIGNQSGGRVFLLLETDDFWRDHELYQKNGIVFEEDPRKEDFGTVAIFKDKYGNRWDLIERKI